MKLSDSEVSLFFKLWYNLIWGINQKRRIVPPFEKPVYGERADLEAIVAVREELWQNPGWIDDYLREEEFGELTELERGILSGWRRDFVSGRFWVMKHTAKYSVLMSADDPTKLYGVVGISDPIKDTLRDSPPFLAETALLPFQDKIIYDSLIGTFNVSFGKNIRDSLNDEYNKNRVKLGVIETMGAPAVPMKAPAKKAASKAAPSAPVDTKGAKIPKAMAARYIEIAEIIEKFCDEKLDNEYRELCLKALQKLCRKRPSPVAGGRARTWASGIVYAVCANNFIFDKSQPIHMTAGELADGFGVAKGTAGQKSAEVSRLLDLSYHNAEFLLQSHIDDNPAIWYLSVNGFYIDVRRAAREVQEEAYRKGLIPYIPADREA